MKRTLEVLTEIYMNPIVRPLAVAVIRATAGWVYHALEDGKIDKPEIAEYVKTIFRMLPQMIGAMALGVPVEVTMLTDYGFNRIKDLAGK